MMIKKSFFVICYLSICLCCFVMGHSCRIVWKLAVRMWKACFWGKLKLLMQKQGRLNALKIALLLRVRLICGAGHSGYP